MEQSRERRLFPRKAVPIDICVKDGQKRFPGEIVDLTVHGLSFRLGRSLSVGSEISIDIQGARKIRNSRLRAEVLRCGTLQNGSPFRYLLAAKFVEVSDEYLMDALALVHGTEDPY
ncbi:MAG: PilZ domain-containing protein [Nitrospinaceae bacterium]